MPLILGWTVLAVDTVPGLDVADDFDLLGHERSAQQEVAHLREAVGLDESLELEDGRGGHVERQWDTHRGTEDQRVLRGCQSLERVNGDALLQTLNQPRTVANRCNRHMTSVSK